MTDAAAHSPSGARQQEQFRASLPEQLRLDELLRALGEVGDQTCLDVGADNPLLSYHLRRHGGVWHSAVMNEDEAGQVREVVGENVHVLNADALPFENKMFDAVAVIGMLERVLDDHVFVEECHRVLKPDGRLVLSVARRKPCSLIPLLRRLPGSEQDRLGWVRPGYTEPQLFRVLKHGFDVHSVRSHGRFFVQLTDAAVNALGGRGPSRWFYTVANLFYRLAFQLDMLLFFTRGHSLVVLAKRRAWRPRMAPVLSDGRTISEAVLSRPGR